MQKAQIYGLVNRNKEMRINIMDSDNATLKKIVAQFTECEARYLVNAITCDLNILAKLQSPGERPDRRASLLDLKAPTTSLDAGQA